MSDTERVLDDLVRTLRVTYGCHTVILYGSHVRGADDTASDIDMLGVTASGGHKHLLRVVEGIIVDAFVEPESAFDTIEESSLRFEHGRVLWEENDFGTRLLARVSERAAEGPPPLDVETDRAVRLGLFRTLKRSRHGYDDDDDLASLQRRASLQGELLADYFKLRGQWYRGVKLAAEWLATHDPRVSEKVAKALRRGASYGDLEEAVGAVLALPEPRLVHHAVLKAIDAVEGADEAKGFRETMRRAFEQGRVEHLPDVSRDDLIGTLKAKVKAADLYGAEIPGLRALAETMNKVNFAHVATWRSQDSRNTYELYTDLTGANLIGWMIPV